MALTKPKLIFQAVIERKKYLRRFMWSLLSGVTAAAAGVALTLAGDRGLIDSRLITAGQIIAVIVSVLSLLRGLVNLVRWLRRRNELVRFFDKGFVWTRSREEFKYSWSQIATFREGVRDVFIGRRPLIQLGAQKLTMRDGRVFRITGAYGNTRQFARAVRPFIADVTGTVMGRALREQRSIRLHPQLVVMPDGVQTGKTRIGWSDLDIAVKNGKLHLRRKTPKGQFKTVRSLDTHQIDNLGGFMEVATSTIRNHQPERFNIKVQGPRRAG